MIFRIFRSVKSEYRLEYLMKRFGGLEFFKKNPWNNVEIVSERLINQIFNVTNMVPTDRNDPIKIAALFRVASPKVSVRRSLEKIFSTNKILFRFGSTTKVGRRVWRLLIFLTTHFCVEFYLNRTNQRGSMTLESLVTVIRCLGPTFRSIVNYKHVQRSNYLQRSVLFLLWLLFQRVFSFFSLMNA